MKRWYVALLMLLLPVFLTACIKIEVVKPGENAPAQTESVQEEMEQEEMEQEEMEQEAPVEAAEPVEEVPVEDMETESTQTIEEKGLWEKCIGVWSTGAGVQTDPVMSYHNYYVCLFENGSVIRFGWRLMDVGSWLGVPDTNRVLASYLADCSSGAFEGWTAGIGADMVSYEHDKETDTLRLTVSTAEELDPKNYPWAKTYYPANRADAYEACARYLSYLEDITWAADVDHVTKEQTEEAKAETAEGLQAVSGMPSQIKNPTELDLTKGYWYQFSSQSANCSEYQFFADGTVRVRQCDVMQNGGAYMDELYPEKEMYAIKKLAYQVTGVGTVIVGGTEMVMAPTLGQLVYSFTESWNEGKVFSGYLKQFDHKLSLEEMEHEAGSFVQDFWNKNIVTLDDR